MKFLEKYQESIYDLKISQQKLSPPKYDKGLQNKYYGFTDLGNGMN